MSNISNDSLVLHLSMIRVDYEKSRPVVGGVGEQSSDWFVNIHNSTSSYIVIACGCGRYRKVFTANINVRWREILMTVITSV